MSRIQASLDVLVASAVAADQVVQLSGGNVRVRGVSVLQFISLLRRFPDVRSTILGLIGADESAEAKTATEVVAMIVDFGPEVVAAVVATGLGGDPEDPAVLAALMQLSDADFVALLDRIVHLTMPGGIGDFFGRFAALAARLGLQPESATTATA